MNVTALNGDILTYAEELYCVVDETAGSRVGLITFGYDVQVVVPLAQRTTAEWAAAVELVRGTLTTVNGYTPLAEALEMAYAQFQSEGQGPAATKLVVVVSDGQPVPLPIAFASNPVTPLQVADSALFPLTGSSYAERYYPAEIVLAPPGSPPGTEPGATVTAYSAYLSTVLPNAVQALRSLGNTRVMLLAVPNGQGVTPPLNYFLGQPYVGGAACRAGVTDPECVGACDYCETFNTLTTGAQCKCATLAGPVVTDPSTDVFTFSSVNATAMVELTQSAACQPTGPSTAAVVAGSLGAGALGAAIAAAVVMRRRRSRSRRGTGSAAAGAGALAAAAPVDLVGGVARSRTAGAAWITQYDAASKATYVLNKATGDFAWSNSVPAQPSGGQRGSPGAGGSAGGRGSVWTQRTDAASGAHVLENPATGEFVWANPVEESAADADAQVAVAVSVPGEDDFFLDGVPREPTAGVSARAQASQQHQQRRGAWLL